LSFQEHPEKKDDAGPEKDAGGGMPNQSQQPSSAPGPSEASLAEQVQRLLAEKQDLTNTLIRRQADFENFRKRVEKERQHDRHRGVELLVERLLPVLDAFENALASTNGAAGTEYRKGFELIYRQLVDILAKQGLKRIESAGKEFNPHFHHAIQRVETNEQPEGTVLDELQPGYMFHERVLRPAMVRVAAAPISESVSDRKREN
jgi:molecular chaperone GrpE